MKTEPEREHVPETIGLIFEKVSNVEATLEKHATERQGSGKAAAVALFAAVLYFGSAAMFPNAGRQQRPIAVEFTSMAINQSALQDSYNENLKQLLADLPNSNAVELKFSSNTGDLANKITLLNANVTNSTKLSLSVSAFLPTILNDFKAQVEARTLSDDQITKLQRTIETLKQTSDKLVACNTNLQSESATYRVGMTNGASPAAQAHALVQMTTTLTSLIRGQSEAVKCMRMVDQFTATFPQLEEIHDNGIIGFNERAEEDTWRLALSRSIAGLLLFFTGNPTRSFVQGLWLKLVKKARRNNVS